MAEHARLAGLQQLRFVAAFLVLVHHVFEELRAHPQVHLPDTLVALGACGVDIFFVISGYVMWHSTRGFAAGVRATDFLRRRARRIYPIYWACLGLLLLAWASGLAYRSLAVEPMRLLSSITLIPLAGRDAPLILGVAWTLVYEMYFYLVCALVLSLRGAVRGALAVPLLLALLPPLAWLGGWEAGWRWFTSPLVLEFCFGLWLGASRFTPGPHLRRALWVVAAACFVSATLLWRDPATHSLNDATRWLAWGLPATLAVMASLPHPLASGRAGAWMTRLGDASYALYLSHGFVMISLATWLRVAAPSLPLAVAGGIAAVCASLAVGLVFHHVLERRAGPWLARRRGAQT
ncbi:MAG: acyltransferase [Candidatus Dactylopiibacterium sp.]|nr:acyltransferase [Candidatus Dactylopiibacterium sp.]